MALYYRYSVPSTRTTQQYEWVSRHIFVPSAVIGSYTRLGSGYHLVLYLKVLQRLTKDCRVLNTFWKIRLKGQNLLSSKEVNHNVSIYHRSDFVKLSDLTASVKLSVPPYNNPLAFLCSLIPYVHLKRVSTFEGSPITDSHSPSLPTAWLPVNNIVKPSYCLTLARIKVLRAIYSFSSSEWWVSWR